MQDAEEKLDQWMRFYRSVQVLLRAGPRALRRLSAAELTRLIDDYQGLTADLARARSFGASSPQRVRPSSRRWRPTPHPCPHAR